MVKKKCEEDNGGARRKNIRFRSREEKPKGLRREGKALKKEGDRGKGEVRKGRR